MTFYTNISMAFELVHSPDLHLSYLNKILKMTPIDVQKTFNTIDHNILLVKLMAIGFYDHTVNWFHSYLTYWAFFASIENN